MRKSLVERFEEANRRPVPYEGLSSLPRNEHSKLEPQAVVESSQHSEDFNSPSGTARNRSPLVKHR